MLRPFVIAAVAIGCGRVGFDAHTAGDGSLDAPGDVADGGAANIRLVQVVAPGFGSAAQVSVTIQQTAGDVLIAAAYWDEVPDTITLSDTAGTAWASLPQLALPGCGGATGNGTGAQMFYAPIATSGSNTVTVAQTSGVQPLGLFLLEYSGVAGLDQHTEQIAPSASNVTFVPQLVTTGTDVIVALFSDTIAMGVMPEGAGYLAEARDTGFPNLIEDAIGPAGSYMPSAGLPGVQNDACWVGAAAAFHAR